VSETVECTRCGRQAPAPETPPLLPADQAAEIRRKVCASCWAEWQNMEVMVINELRLNFMDPRSQEILEQQMREFLALDSPRTGDEPLPPGIPPEAAGGSG
jgi:Fe-S cluster biosynthesis and repair protein YggX